MQLLYSSTKFSTLYSHTKFSVMIDSFTKFSMILTARSSSAPSVPDMDRSTKLSTCSRYGTAVHVPARTCTYARPFVRSAILVSPRVTVRELFYLKQMRAV